MKVTFEEVKTWRSRTVIVDGKKKRQSKTFAHTINPYNRNEKGQVKTYDEVLKDVNAEADNWVQNVQPL